MCLIISKNVFKYKMSLVVMDVKVDTAGRYGWIIDQKIKL